MAKKDINIIFDLGGVFVPDSTDLLNKTIAESVGITKEKLSKLWKDALPKLFTGKMTIRELYMVLFGTNYNAGLLLEQHIETYKSKFEIDNFMLKLLLELNSNYTTACLSNTEIEIAKVNYEFGLYSHFQYAFLSTEIGMMKPNIDIFSFVLEKLGANNERTIFIDDKIENIDTAEKMGLKTILFTKGSQVKKELLAILTG